METTGWILLVIGTMGLLYIGFSGTDDAESASTVAQTSRHVPALVAALILFLLGLILVLESTQF